MKDHTKTFVLILLIFLALIIGSLITSCEPDEYDKMQLEIIKKEHKVDYDYEIDLKPNYIIVYSRGGNVDTIPYAINKDCVSPIEAFFESDNI